MLNLPKIMFGACLVAVLGPVHGLDKEIEETIAAERSELPKIEIGATTNSILELQRSGLAAGHEQPMQGEVAARSYQRYLDTYRQTSTIGRVDGSASIADAQSSP
ncbi:MAG: DUF3613 domain-containing protein [Thiohalomonadaceae bacterium]